MDKENAKVAKVIDRSWLEQTRRIKGLRQADVAAQCEISSSYYSRIERGLEVPNVGIGIRIADVLGFDVRDWTREVSYN